MSSASTADPDYKFNPFSVIRTVKGDSDGSTQLIEFEELEAYTKAQNISCHRQGLFSAYNFFKTDRGFGSDRWANQRA